MVKQGILDLISEMRSDADSTYPLKVNIVAWDVRKVIQATSSQATAANEAATSVLRKAVAVTESTRISLPALKPYHPNQSNPVPRATRGML